MDDHFSRILLALRRFIGVPLPTTELRVHGLLRTTESSVRLLLGSEGTRQQTVDLPLYRAGSSEKYAPWWYVTAIRKIAIWLSEQSEDHLISGAVQAEALFAQGVIDDEMHANLDDALDFVVSDLVADPLWHDAAASAAPDIYALVGFRLLDAGTVRVYLQYHDDVIGVDLAVTGRSSHQPRTPGWWASTKVVAILRDDATLAAHLAPTVEDRYCDAVYDLTHWA